MFGYIKLSKVARSSYLCDTLCTFFPRFLYSQGLYLGTTRRAAAGNRRKERSRSMDDAYCPDCDGKIVLNPDVKLGQKLTCPHCEAELEVISLDPVELDWAYDWEWEDEEEDLEEWEDIEGEEEDELWVDDDEY